MKLVRQQAGDSDMRFGFDLKRQAEGQYIAETYGWDEAWQWQQFQEKWRAHPPDLILLDGKVIGTLLTLEGEGQVYLGQFFLLPAYQGRGIGSRILRSLLQDADKRQQTLTLTVLTGNPAQRLYTRLGFDVVEQDGYLLTMQRACTSL